MKTLLRAAAIVLALASPVSAQNYPAGTYSAPGLSIQALTMGLYSPAPGFLGFVTLGCAWPSINPDCIGPVVIDPAGMVISGAERRQVGWTSNYEINVVMLPRGDGGYAGSVPVQINAWNPGSAHFEPVVWFRSRGATLGSAGAVQPGDTVMLMQATPDDGTGPRGNLPISINLQGDVDGGCGPVAPHYVPTMVSTFTTGDNGYQRTLLVDCHHDLWAENGKVHALKGLYVIGGGTFDKASIADLSVGSRSPASATPCTAGEMVTDASFIYVCGPAGVFRRAALSDY